MALFPTGTSAEEGDDSPADYWQKLGMLLNTGASSFYNVRNPDFGASPAASASFNRGAFQDCIDASDVGDTILVPPGIYEVDAPLLRDPFRRYMGWGPAWADQTVIKVANGSSANFQSTSGHSGIFVPRGWNDNGTVASGPVEIANLSFDGNQANNGTGQHSCILLYDEYWSTFTNVRCYNARKKGVLLTRTAKNNVAQVSGISDLAFHNLHCAANLEDGVCQLSSGAANNTDIVFTGRTLLYDNGGSAMIADNPGGWLLNNVHYWNNGEHGIYFDSGSHAVEINGLYGESFGIDAAAATQYFGLRLRIFNDAVPPTVCNATIQTTDPAGTSSFYCYSFVGDGADTHIYTSNVHALGAGTARGHGIEWYADTGDTLNVHDANSGATDFNAGQGKEYGGPGTYVYDPPRVLTGTTTWDMADTASGSSATQTLTVTGAAVGDLAVASLSTLTTAGSITISARVTAANTVSVTVRNDSGGNVNPASGTLRATVWKH